MIVVLTDPSGDPASDPLGAAGSPSCPSCSGRLRPWGYARPRRLRGRGGGRDTRDYREEPRRRPERAARRHPGRGSPCAAGNARGLPGSWCWPCFLSIAAQGDAGPASRGPRVPTAGPDDARSARDARLPRVSSVLADGLGGSTTASGWWPTCQQRDLVARRRCRQRIASSRSCRQRSLRRRRQACARWGEPAARVRRGARPRPRS